MEQVISNIYGDLPQLLRESHDRRCGGWFSNPLNSKGITYCAIGTISHQMGLHPISIFFGAGSIFNRDEFLKFCNIDPNMKHTKVDCPNCKEKNVPFIQLISHNNDAHKMSFSENADALEQMKL